MRACAGTQRHFLAPLDKALLQFALEEVLVVVVEQFVDIEDFVLVLGLEVLIVHYPPIIEYLNGFN